MKEKEIYAVPTLEVISLYKEDIVTLSNPDDFEKIFGEYDKDDWE